MNDLTGSLSHYKDLRWEFIESEAFNFYTTHPLHFSNFAPYMEVFVIAGWDQNTQDEQFTLLRPADSLSREIFKLDWFFQTRCLWISIHSVNFLRRCVTKSVDFAQLEKISLDKLTNPFNYYV